MKLAALKAVLDTDTHEKLHMTRKLIHFSARTYLAACGFHKLIVFLTNPKAWARKCRLPKVKRWVRSPYDEDKLLDAIVASLAQSPHFGKSSKRKQHPRARRTI